MVNGKKAALPVRAPLVYDGTEGGLSMYLATQIFDTLIKNIHLEEDDLQRIAGLFCYISILK